MDHFYFVYSCSFQSHVSKMSKTNCYRNVIFLFHGIFLYLFKRIRLCLDSQNRMHVLKVTEITT